MEDREHTDRHQDTVHGEDNEAHLDVLAGDGEDNADLDEVLDILQVRREDNWVEDVLVAADAVAGDIDVHRDKLDLADTPVYHNNSNLVRLNHSATTQTCPG